MKASSDTPKVHSSPVITTRCIRTKLLNSLGMFRNNDQREGRRGGAKVAPSGTTQKWRQEWAPTLKSSLKLASTKMKSSRSVAFNVIVKMHSIPSRYDYCDFDREKIWNSSAELMEMERRNIIEFDAESWDWRNVVTDDEMYVDDVTGELIHPIHVSRRRLQPVYERIYRTQISCVCS